MVHLHKVAVMLAGFTPEFVIEFDAGAARGSKEVQTEKWQYLVHSIL